MRAKWQGAQRIDSTQNSIKADKDNMKENNQGNKIKMQFKRKRVREKIIEKLETEEASTCMFSLIFQLGRATLPS